MYNKSFVIIITCLLIFSLSGCAKLPVLEGGQLKVLHGGEENDALDELSKVDLIYELDPMQFGACHELDPEEPQTPIMKLKCAFDGFYSERYFDEVAFEGTRAKSLDVSHVAFAYAEKQLARIKELAKKFDELTDEQKRTYESFGFGQEIQANFMETQVKELNRRVEVANQNSKFLEFQRQRRNHVLARVLLASDATCDSYKRRLNSVYSTSNFGFGGLATVTGGLGALFTNADVARALSGAAGITSGIRAEYNDAFFRNKVVELLTKAMEISRNRKREEIRRKSLQIVSDYSMEDAIDDAVLYNSQCTLVAGLQETSESLQTVSDPGLKWLANAFGGAASNSKLTAELFKSLGGAVGAVQQIQKATEDQNAIIPAEPNVTATTTP